MGDWGLVGWRGVGESWVDSWIGICKAGVRQFCKFISTNGKVGSMNCHLQLAELAAPESCTPGMLILIDAYRQVAGDGCEGGWQPRKVPFGGGVLLFPKPDQLKKSKVWFSSGQRFLSEKK